MTVNPKIILSDHLAAEALHLMELYKITVLCVADADKKIIGVLQIYDLLNAGLA
jgi:arabinose-5-phosphate isomerase